MAVFLLTAPWANGDSLEDAARTLARKAAQRIPISDSVKLAERNLSSLPASEAVRARQTFERALRRAQRNPPVVEVTVTLSENARELLLVVEIVRGDTRSVDIVAFRPAAESPSNHALPAPTKRLVWEQSGAVLDLKELGDSLLVAGLSELVLYQKRDHWTRGVAWPMPVLARDPRARLEVEGDAVSLNAPGRLCRGTWRPALSLDCSAAAGENNLWAGDGWPPHFSSAILSNGATVVAEIDGRTHLYDATRKHLSSWGGWGPNVAVACGSRILADTDREAEKSDALRLYSLAGDKPAAGSAPLDLPGPVTALWPVTGGAMAIVRDLSSQEYAAYHVSVDCAQ